MKIVARTVKGDTNVTLEVSPADTIASVKAKIKAELSLELEAPRRTRQLRAARTRSRAQRALCST